MSIQLFAQEKFRVLLADRFPIILIDEYQDTDSDWVNAIKGYFLDGSTQPLFGFFGDHWQKIYGDGCGKLDHKAVHEIGKKANFRSVNAVVECLNRMRPELPQFVVDPSAPGEVRVFHSNAWTGQRLKGPHYGGDLPEDESRQALAKVKEMLKANGWDFAVEKTKILMLTHKSLASEQGYSDLARCFEYNDSFTKKENPYIAFFVDTLEPVCDAHGAKRYGEMFSLLGDGRHGVTKIDDKKLWTDSLAELTKLREIGTVGEIIQCLERTKRPALSEKILKIEKDVVSFDEALVAEKPRSLREAEALKKVAYQQVKALRRYLDGFSPFETKHGVKGAEFENVLVVLGRGWNKYNYNNMLELAGKQIPADKLPFYENNRNLFYVSCSRARKRLCLLFTQQLSEVSLAQLTKWFGANALAGIEI